MTNDSNHEKISMLGLSQGNSICNSRNVILDLFLTNFSFDFEIDGALDNDLLDTNTVHHTALSM